MENTEQNPFMNLQMDPNEVVQSYENNTLKQENPFVELAAKESWGKSIIRYLAQIPKGIANMTTGGILTNLINMIAQGESLDPGDIENLKRISEREGIPFNEDAYMEAVQQAAETFPTVSNIARGIENYSKESKYLPHIPLEAKTRGQEFVEFASGASKLAPKTPTTFRGLNTALPRSVLGTGVAATAEAAKELGIPEPIADIGSFALLKQLPPGSPALEIGTATKPSGLTTRQFEKIKEPKSISEGKFQQINQKLEKDFKGISDKIIAESPIGETATNLKNDPTYKQASRELLDEAQVIANSISKPMSSTIIKNEIDNLAGKKVKGFALNEYDKSYLKYMQEAKKDILPENITAGELVEQYRKNNRSLSEYFEPGASKAINRAKSDALLDQNRAIAGAMEKVYPESELVPVFKDGNARWTKIMDAEAVDEFLGEVFTGEKINFKKLHDFFDKEGYGRIFKRALGEEGVKDFEQLLKDTLTTETPYKMLKVAQKKGYDSLFRTGLAYVLHPKIGIAKAGFDATKYAYKFLINSMLDKPQIAFTFRRGINNLKKGDFKAAERHFNALKQEAEVLPKEAEGGAKNAKSPVNETEIDITPEKTRKAPKELSFQTEKGSTYTVNEDGTTTRNKSFRPEHGKSEKGIQRTSEKTYYISSEDAQKLGEFQTSGPGKQIVELPDGSLGVMYTEGINKGKIESRTVIKPSNEPSEGSIPLELWEGGEKAHFGNKITKINKPKETSQITTQKEPKQIESKVSDIKRQDISKTGLKSQKKFLLDKLDKAIKGPPGNEFIHIDIPGDGEFKIKNDPKIIETFRKKVEKIWPDKPFRIGKKKLPEYGPMVEVKPETPKKTANPKPPKKTKLQALEESYEEIDKKIDRNVTYIERLNEKDDSTFIMELSRKNKEFEKQKDKIRDRIAKIKNPKPPKSSTEKSERIENSIAKLLKKKQKIQTQINDNPFSGLTYQRSTELKEINKKIEKLESKLNTT